MVDSVRNYGKGPLRKEIHQAITPSESGKNAIEIVIIEGETRPYQVEGSGIVPEILLMVELDKLLPLDEEQVIFISQDGVHTREALFLVALRNPPPIEANHARISLIRF